MYIVFPKSLIWDVWVIHICDVWHMYDIWKVTFSVWENVCLVATLAKFEQIAITVQ